MHTPAPTPQRPPLTAEQLPDDLATLKAMIVELAATLRQCQQDKVSLQYRLDLLLRRLYGPRSERIDPAQRLLFDEPPAAAGDPATPPEPAAPPPAKRRCRPHGRRRLPEDLPRQTQHHELPEALRLCTQCGTMRLDIGVDKSEQLEYRPASLWVIEHLRHKYVCPCCSRQASVARGVAVPAPESVAVADEQPTPPSAPPNTKVEAQSPDNAGPVAPPPVIVSAGKPAAPIAKGLPGPGLLAHLIVSKYTDHLPLYRLERIYERQGVFLPRSTLSDWLAACAELLRPLYARMAQAVLQSRSLHTDDTPVKMQDPRTHVLSTARLWGYLGDAAHPYNVFDFTTSRKRDGPATFLANYQGYLHADAFSGYDGLYLPAAAAAPARIIEVACNAHARRKFYEARTSDTLLAHQALAYYGQLYELEASAQRIGLDEEGRRRMRHEVALPILGRFREFLEAQRGAVLPKSPMAEAIGYALNNWTALVRYTEAGFLAIDNNAAEREMKRIAIGRKNGLFVGSTQGGQTAAVHISFASTCRRLGVEPWAYLQDVLARLPNTAAEQVEELLPERWQAARAVTAGGGAAGGPSGWAPAEHPGAAP
jgi:transposase